MSIVLARDAVLVVTGVILVLAAWEATWQGPLVGNSIGGDFHFYQAAARHWLATGSFYLPEQLAGPYSIRLMVDVLYPPVALYLFVPFLWLPGFLWWAIPLGVLAYALWRWRPALWAWPLLSFAIFWPRTQGALLQGNTDLWVAAGVAAGLLWGGPTVLVVLKPTFAPLALVGLGRRWVAGWLVLAAMSLPMLPLWGDYVITIQNSGIPWTYSLYNIVLPLAPLVAWVARDGSAHSLASTWARLSSHAPALRGRSALEAR